MVWDATPWFVGGNAKHSEEVARELAFIATGGAEGVAQPGDLKVVPAAPPGGSIVVSTGGCVIRNRGSNSYEQSYVARNQTGDPITISPTGSTGGRSDLIVARVEDLNAVGGSQWQNNGADPDDGPFVFTRVIPNVPNTTTSLQAVSGHANDVGIALARIDIPANTGTITAAMIKDLRKLARPRSQRDLYPGTPSDNNITMSTLTWKAFPTNDITGITVPSWATHAVIRVDTTLRYRSGDGYANMQAFLGPQGQQDDDTLFTDLQLDTIQTNSDGYRQPLILPSNGLWTIPTAIRGTSGNRISSRVRAKNTSGGVIGTAAGDYLFADITWMERAA